MKSFTRDGVTYTPVHTSGALTRWEASYYELEVETKVFASGRNSLSEDGVVDMFNIILG